MGKTLSMSGTVRGLERSRWRVRRGGGARSAGGEAGGSGGESTRAGNTRRSGEELGDLLSITHFKVNGIKCLHTDKLRFLSIFMSV